MTPHTLFGHQMLNTDLSRISAFWCGLIGGEQLAGALYSKSLLDVRQTAQISRAQSKQALSTVSLSCVLPMLTFFFSDKTFAFVLLSCLCHIHHAWDLAVDLPSDSWEANYCVFIRNIVHFFFWISHCAGQARIKFFEKKYFSVFLFIAKWSKSYGAVLRSHWN